MPKLTKKLREEWSFFLDPTTGRRTCNTICRGCIHGCKQSFRAVLIACPHYKAKRAVYYSRKKDGKTPPFDCKKEEPDTPIR